MDEGITKWFDDEFEYLICEIETYSKEKLTEDNTFFLYDVINRVGWSHKMISEMIESGEEVSGGYSIDLFTTKISAMIQAGVCDEKSYEDYKKTNETFDDLVERIRLSTGKRHFSVIELTLVIHWQKEWADDVIIAAFEYTLQKGINAIFLYVKDVLINWKKQGINNLDDIKQIIGDKKRENISRHATRMTKYNEYPKNPLYHNFDTTGLLACPFCGGEDILLQSQYSQKADGYYCMVVCNVCGSRTRSIKNDIEVTPNSPYFWRSVVIDEVRALWNTRA